MPALSNRVQQKLRHQQIIQDYLLGLNYQQLSTKYDLDKSSIHYVLNKEDAKKICEAAFNRRVELLPKAVDIERDLLMNGKEATKVKIIHKLADDTGIGRASTPFALFQSITINTLEPEAQRYIESKSADIGINQAIDAEFEEVE